MSKQNLLTSQLSILLLGVVIGVFASIGFSYISKPSIHQVGTACTAEAKICPDGSTVGRVGPNCEFTPCSATISKPPGYFDTGCSIDDDCVLLLFIQLHEGSGDPILIVHGLIMLPAGFGLLPQCNDILVRR